MKRVGSQFWKHRIDAELHMPEGATERSARVERNVDLHNSSHRRYNAKNHRQNENDDCSPEGSPVDPVAIIKESLPDGLRLSFIVDLLNRTKSFLPERILP